MSTGQRLRDDDARAVDAQMKLLPTACFAAAVFRGRPLAFARDRESGAVHDEMNTIVDGHSTQRQVEPLAAPRERRVIGGGELDTQYPEDRGQKTLRLAEWKVEEEPKRQRGFDGRVGVLQLPAPPRLPTPAADHVAITSGVSHTVTLPRWTSARSYAGQLPTRYCVLYLGCTLDFTSRSCAFARHDG